MPAAGKSTWVKKTFDSIDSDLHLEDFAVISSDDYIDKWAAREGKTYNEVFSKYSARAIRRAFDDAEKWFAYTKPWFHGIIWDQTNLTVKKRANILTLCPEDWRKVCVVLERPEEEEWRRRLASREGKIIPEEVLVRMERSYQPPTLDEGFDNVVFWRGEETSWSG